MVECSVCGCGWVSVDGCGAGCGSGQPAFTDGTLPRLQRKDVFATPDRSFGRLDDFCRTGLAAITFALRDAGLEQWSEKRPIAVYAASGNGCLAVDRAYYATVATDNGALASPQLFAYTLPNTFLGEAARRFGLCGNCMVINCARDNFAAVLHCAIDSIASAEHEQVLVGYCDLDTSGPLKAPGALFLLLRRRDENSSSALHISTDTTGAIRCNGEPLADIGDLLAELGNG